MKEKERELAQYEAKHKKEFDKVADQSKDQIRVLNNKLNAMEQGNIVINSNSDKQICNWTRVYL